MGQDNDETKQYVIGTCDTILDTSKTIYNEESERFKQAESKTNITLAFVGVLFGAYLTYIGAFTPTTVEISYLLYTYIFKLVVFVLFVVSITYFLRAVQTGDYDQVSLENIVNEKLAITEEALAKLQVSATYRDAINLNKSRLDSKMKLYSTGLNLMFWGFILFAIHFVIEEVIRNVA